jgi:transposase
VDYRAGDVVSVRLGCGPGGAVGGWGGAGDVAVLFWLAWSRFRVVISTWDRTLPTLLSCVDTALRRLGGAPTYALTDNEKTVTVEHVARVAVRHPEIVAAGRYYGMQVATCVPFDQRFRGVHSRMC